MSEGGILLFGANGQVGRELRRVLPGLGPLIAIDRSEVDLADPAGLRAAVQKHRPETIVNAAAFTAVDQAEDEPEQARAVNAVAPGVLAAAAAAVGASLVHYSTDYVFDGRRDVPYRESDLPAPLSVYGRTKLEGERAVAGGGARHLILRTSWVFSPHGTNFLKTMLRLAAERETLTVVADQHGAPTSPF